MKPVKQKFSKIFKKLEKHLSEEKPDIRKTCKDQLFISPVDEFDEIDELRRLSEEVSTTPARMFTQT